MSYGRKFGGLFCVAIALVAPLCVAASAATPHAGAIAISVDATQVSQRILHAKLVFPVHPGPLTLYYPKWMPADHSPDGPVWNVVGLKFFSGTQEIPWQQDDVDMYAFDLNVPAGTTSIDASLDFLISAPGPTIDFSASGAANLFILMWNQVLLYPKGWPAADLIFHPTLTLPGNGNSAHRYRSAANPAARSHSHLFHSTCSLIRRCSRVSSCGLSLSMLAAALPMSWMCSLMMHGRSMFHPD